MSMIFASYIYEPSAAHRAIRTDAWRRLSAVFVRGASSREREDIADSPSACGSRLAIYRSNGYFKVKSARSTESFYFVNAVAQIGFHVTFTNVWLHFSVFVRIGTSTSYPRGSGNLLPNFSYGSAIYPHAAQ